MTARNPADTAHPATADTTAGPVSSNSAHTVEFVSVSHRFGDRTVLRPTDLTLTEHLIGIVGANGSGKSTLVRMINGLVTPTGGRVLVDGLDAAAEGRAVRRKVGFVFTDPDTQIVMPTVAEDVAFSLRRSGLSKSEISERVMHALADFGLADLADHPAHLLSGGQKQLLALAAVLVREPEIVVADEPTTLLDRRNARRITAWLTGLEQQVIVVTHALDLLEDFDRVIVIDDGEVVADGAPADALAHYRDLCDAGTDDEVIRDDNGPGHALAALRAILAAGGTVIHRAATTDDAFVPEAAGSAAVIDSVTAAQNAAVIDGPGVAVIDSTTVTQKTSG